MKIECLDHLVLTVKDIEQTADFYQRVLGMHLITFGAGRKALSYGSQKINLHQHHQEFEPKAQQPTPGSAGLCFLTTTPLSQVIEHLRTCAIPIIEGPVPRTGAGGPIMSVYIRDPDFNLIELANQLDVD